MPSPDHAARSPLPARPPASAPAAATPGGLAAGPRATTRGRSGAPHRSALARLGVLVAGALLLVGGFARPASAHAELDGTDPSDGSVLEASPGALRLMFSEGISVEADGVRVVNADLERVDTGKARAKDFTVTVPLRPDLPDGGYIVSWRVVSADGHPVHGAFQFFVGSRTLLDPGLADKAFAASADRRDEIVGAVVRGLAYLGTLLACGAVLVGGLLHRDGDPPPVNRVTASAAGLAICALLVQVPVQTSLVTGRGWGSVTEAGVLGRSLADGVGWALAVTIFALVAVLITTGLPFRGAVRTIAFTGAAIAPLGFAITGHSRTMSPAAVAYAADAAHLIAGAVWLGGLVALLSLLRFRRRRDDVVGAGDAVARFSGLAGATLAAVMVAGLALGWIEVGGLEALRSTTYGRLLMAKVAVVGLVVAGAAWNRFRLVPVLGRLATEPTGGHHHPLDARLESVDGEVEAGDDDPAVAPVGVVPAEDPVGVLPVPTDPRWGHFARLVGLEVAGLVVVLALTAVLANVTPAKAAVHRGPVTASGTLGDGSVQVIVDPARPGRNDVHVYLLDAAGRPDRRYDTADLSLALPAQDIGPLKRTPVRAAPGHFQLVGTDLTVKGDWTLTVTVHPDRFTEEQAVVSFKVR